MTAVASLPPRIRSYLDDFVVRSRRLALSRAIAVSVSMFLGWMLLWCAVDRFAHLSESFRLILLVLGTVMALVGIIPRLLALRGEPDWVSTAVEVERQNPKFAQRLVTVTSRLLGAADYRGSDQILSRLVREVDEQVAVDRPPRLRPVRMTVGPWAVVAFLVILLAMLLHVPGLRFKQLSERFLEPLAAIPPVTTTQLSVEPGDRDLVQSQSLTINVQTERLGDSPVTLYLGEDGRNWSRIAMLPAGAGRFSFNLASVDRDVRYYVQGGDAKSPHYLIRVLRRPAVAQFKIRYEYPPYTRLPPNTITNTDGRIEAPGGTNVRLTVYASEPLQAALLTLGTDRLLMDRTADPSVRQAQFTVRSDAKYSLDLISTRDVAGAGPPGMMIRAVPDLPPQVRLARGGDTLRLNPRDIVPVWYEALDDYGLKSLLLRVQVNAQDPVDLPVRLWGDPRRQQDVFNFDLATLPLGIGDVVKISALATDSAGHITQSTPLQVAVSPRSVDLDAYQRISELHNGSQLAQTLASQFDESIKAETEALGQHDHLSPAYVSAVSRADRALSAASQTATLLRQSLLRTTTHSRSSQLSVALAGWVDAAESESAAAEDAFRQSGVTGGMPEIQRNRTRAAFDQARQVQSQLAIVERGEQAAAVLADYDNLAAVQKRPIPKDEPSRRRLRETLLRMRQDLSVEAGQLSLDVNAGDFANQLRSRIQAESDALRDARPVDFAGAARDWSQQLRRDPLQRLGMEGRFSAAAQAEAIRPDADLIRARDLELASRAASAITASARAGKKPASETVANLFASDLDTLAHAWGSTGAKPAKAETKARQDLARLADDSNPLTATSTRGSASPPDDRQKEAENLAMQASAAAANHEYQDAANLDQALVRRLEGGTERHDTSPSSTEPELTAVSDRLEHHEQAVQRQMSTARQLDDLTRAQKDLETQNSSKSVELANKQQTVAQQIADVEKQQQAKPLGDGDSINGRDQAASQVLAAQEQLSSMPQALATLLSAAAVQREAGMRARMARAAAGNSPPNQRDAANRAAEEADQTAADAASRRDRAAEPVSAKTAQSLAERLEPFAPECDGARALIVGQLAPALDALQQAVRGPDAGAVDRTAGDARKAIESCQRELSVAQDQIMQRDPLVAARWFARAAAESLSTMPPDLSHAKSHQAHASAALSRAWDQSIHRAAAERLSAIPSMASVLDGALQTGNGSTAQAAGKFAAAREWGRIRPQEGPDVNAAMHDADPAGYEESLKLYFEALGKAQEAK